MAWQVRCSGRRFQYQPTLPKDMTACIVAIMFINPVHLRKEEGDMTACIVAIMFINPVRLRKEEGDMTACIVAIMFILFP